MVSITPVIFSVMLLALLPLIRHHLDRKEPAKEGVLGEEHQWAFFFL